MPDTTKPQNNVTASVKFHVSLNVSDLPRSVEFYRTLFGVGPASQHADYAKFELDEPPLVLSLIPDRSGASGNLNHVGLRVGSSEELVKIQTRLETAGNRTKREEGVACCHSRQTKFWVTDPDRALWELYILQADDDEQNHDETPRTSASENPPPGTDRVVWEHRITDPWPIQIPHADNSVHAVFLEGSANLKPAAASLAGLFAEALRVLRPGGEFRLHGLSSDSPLSIPLPSLPGPAAAVEYVPSHVEPLRELLAAGFVEVQLEKLSATAHFNVGGVPLREILIVACKPGHRPKTSNHVAIYLGPLAQVTDDFGNVFRRGELKLLNVHDWQLLSKSIARSQFLLLAPKSVGAN